MAEARRWTEKTLTEALQSRYGADKGFVMLNQVPDGTGMHKQRTADALAMQVWPSRGLKLYGFEMKVARADWLRELKNPAKAESIARYCHYWHIVAPKGVVPVDELPALWGLIEIGDDGKSYMRRAAPERADVKPVDLKFVAGILRAGSRTMNTSEEMKRVRRDAHFDGVRDGREQAEKELADRKAKLREAMVKLKDLEDQTGLRLRGYQPKEDQLAAMRAALNPADPAKRLQRLSETAKAIQRDIEVALGQLEVPA